MYQLVTLAQCRRLVHGDSYRLWAVQNDRATTQIESLEQRHVSTDRANGDDTLYGTRGLPDAKVQ